jgi:hypothetical protein
LPSKSTPTQGAKTQGAKTQGAKTQGAKTCPNIITQITQKPIKSQKITKP